MIGNGLLAIRKKMPLFKNGNHPIDFGLTFRGKRIFGDNKTIEGYALGLFLAFLTVTIQYFLHRFEFVRQFELVDYSNPLIFLIGIVQGFAAVLGDSLKSFFKRQIGIEAGKPFFFFDQTDMVFTSIIFSALFYPVAPINYLILLIAYPFLHIFFHIVAYLLKLRDTWI